MRAPLPVGWPVIEMMAQSSATTLKTAEVFSLLYDVLRHPTAPAKEEAAALLLRLLRLPPSRDDGRQAWPVEKLAPLAHLVKFYEAHKDAAGLLPRHVQLYAELLAALPGSGSCTEGCASADTVTWAMSGLDWNHRPSALPPTLLGDFQKIAHLDNFCVGLLFEYRTELHLSGEAGRGPLGACIAALPPKAACEFALRKVDVLKRCALDWSPTHDDELLILAATVLKRTPGGAPKLSDLTPQRLAGFSRRDPEVQRKCPSLARRSNFDIEARWKVVLAFSRALQDALPHVHTGWTAQPHTLGARICALRGLITWDVKLEIWEAALPKPPSDSGVLRAGHVVSLNRFAAEQALQAGGSSAQKKLMFDQLFDQLDDIDPKKIQRTDRGFKVRFVGESSDDYGGPYREALTNICAELQSQASPLFMLCPNGRHGLGLNRSACTVRPSAAGDGHLAQFAFLGKLMGCALMQKQASLDLELCAHFWKRLVSYSLDPADLAQFDDAYYNSLQKMRHIDVTDGIDADMFNDIFFNTFEVDLSDGTTLELLDDGASVDVTFANRHRYCDLAIAARLEEGAQQCDAILAGLRTVVPAIRLLPLLTARELELLTCGEADVDLAMLKRHTSYGASITGGENAPHIRIFWQVLQDFEPDDRRAFLTFAWGRNRLPLTDADWAVQAEMKIHTLETPRPNDHLPASHTCFFSLEWPKYTNKAAAHAKLLYAIRECRAIDMDNTAEGRANRDNASAFS